MGRSFWLLWSGQAVSAFGDAFGNLAMGWLVYALTGSKLAMGSLFLTFFLPQIALWMFGGPLLDRFNRRNLMISLDLMRALAYAVPPLLAATGHLQLWHLYALSFVEGATGAMFHPASMALLPSIVSEEHLVRANSLSMGAWTATGLIGPMAAGALVAAAGSQAAMLVDALSFAGSALTLFLLPVSAGRVEQRTHEDAEPYLSRLVAGYRFFLRAPALLAIMCLLALSNMGGTAVGNMTIPWVQEQIGAGPAAVGMVNAAVALGMLASTLFIGWKGEFRHRRLAMLGGLAGCSLMNAALAFVGHGQLALGVVFMVMMGFISPFWDTNSQVVYQRVVPDHLMGRVMSVRLLVGQGMRPVGAMLGALLADRYGLRTDFLVFGLLPAILTVGAMFLPMLRWIDGELRPLE
jgi:MFS family permease